MSLPQAHGRLLVALAVLGVLALPHWPSTVDDVYITVGYARQWADTGELTWTTGERVEGYSNFLLVAALAVVARLGLDVDVWAQLVAAAAAGGALAWVHQLLPRTPAGTLALLALAAWAPLARWSMIGMETTAYTLLLTVGWTWVLARPARWGAGVALLALASITRPEGVLHLAVAIVSPILRPKAAGRSAGPALLALPALALYHAARIGWFGEVAPTPWLVKVAPIGLTPYGLRQLVGDLLTAGGIGAALALSGRLPLRALAWALVPLAIQAATLVRASGDWMSWGRLTLPGVLASAAALAALSAPRPALPRLALAIGAVGVLLASAWEPRGYGTVDLRLRSLSAVVRGPGALTHGLDTPLAEDVRWAVDNVPTGAEVLIVDAGMLGNIPGIRWVDMRGLTHRPAAEAIAAGGAEDWLRARIADPSSRPAFLRLDNWEDESHPDYPDWLVGPYALRADLRYGGGSIRWYATTDATPPPAERRARWDALLAAHPSQPFLWMSAARSAATEGDLERADRLWAEGGRRWPRMPEFRAPLTP